MPRKKAAIKTTPPVANDLSEWVSEIDLEATQDLIDQLQSEGTPWFKFDVGKGKYKVNYVRICPKRPDWPNPYQVTPVHYLGPNRRMVVCLKESGLASSCPACDLQWELYEADAKEESRALRHSIRTFMNVIKVDKDGNLDEDEKVYLLGLNQIQFMGKRGVEYDPDEESDLPLYNFFTKYGDLSHAEHGRDLLVKAKEDKSGDFNTTALKFAVADPSPFPGTSAMLKEGLNDITTVATLMQPDEIVATIEGRSTSVVVLPSIPPVPALPAPTAPANNGRFGGADTEEDEAANATTRLAAEGATEPDPPEEEPDARAAATPPQTDPGAAIARLRANQAKE